MKSRRWYKQEAYLDEEELAWIKQTTHLRIINWYGAPHCNDVTMTTMASQIHQPHDCLLNPLFRLKSKKTSKLRVTGLCQGNSPGTGEFPAQMASYAENVSIWWRHHAWNMTLWMYLCNYLLLKHVANDVDVCSWFAAGDRVVPELGLPCSRCELCKAGRYNLCKGYSRGGFAHYLCYPETFCHK